MPWGRYIYICTACSSGKVHCLHCHCCPGSDHANCDHGN
jgi:hypothetical protein